MARYRVHYIHESGERGTVQTDEPAERGSWFFGHLDEGVTVTKCYRIADPDDPAPVRDFKQAWAHAMREAH